jgi:hypothetical protein
LALNCDFVATKISPGTNVKSANCEVGRILSEIAIMARIAGLHCQEGFATLKQQVSCMAEDRQLILTAEDQRAQQR